ncbi:MAG: hypothetical protein D6820_13575, partial [Lentisphaerae bacterium]
TLVIEFATADDARQAAIKLHRFKRLPSYCTKDVARPFDPETSNPLSLEVVGSTVIFSSIPETLPSKQPKMKKQRQQHRGKNKKRKH